MTTYGIEMIGAHRRGRRQHTQDGRCSRRARRRWKLERLFAWLHNSRRLVTRWERKVENFVAMLHLACARILLRDSMFAFLRALKLNPIEFSHGVKATKKGEPGTLEVVDAMFKAAAAVVVVLTPDDEARLKKEFRKSSDPTYEKNLTGQPRANVLFEAGRAFGSHSDDTILVQVGSIRLFSDAAGLHVVHLGDSPEGLSELATRLETAAARWIAPPLPNRRCGGTSDGDKCSGKLAVKTLVRTTRA